jgi:type IV secretion system protein VirB5
VYSIDSIVVIPRRDKPDAETAAIPEKSQSTGYNPYLAARREWDERYGDLITRARNWRAMAFVSGMVALIATAGVLYLSMRSRVQPFVVAVDSLGRPLAAALADQASSGDDRLKRATIFGWIDDLRMVTADGIAQRKAIDRVYAHIADSSQAQTFISEFYRGNPPQKRAQTETVSIEVNAVLPTSDRTFEVEWIETTRDLYGAIKSQEHWKGAFTISVNPPVDEGLARINPLGIYITSASWSKVI